MAELGRTTELKYNNSIMSDELLKHISEYFNTFPEEDYTIYVNGTPTELCKLNACKNVVWKILLDDGKNDWNFVYIRELEAIRLTPTTMELVTTDGTEYKLTAKLKPKEKKVKEIILKTKNALYNCHIVDALDYLDKLETLMDE